MPHGNRHGSTRRRDFEKAAQFRTASDGSDERQGTITRTEASLYRASNHITRCSHRFERQAQGKLRALYFISTLVYVKQSNKSKILWHPVSLHVSYLRAASLSISPSHHYGRSEELCRNFDREVCRVVIVVCENVASNITE